MWKKAIHPPLYALAAALLLGGCVTSQHQELIFAAADLDDANPELKFYRISIDAHAVNNQTNLQSGFYDATAVRGLYGTVPSGAGDANPYMGSGMAAKQLFFEPKNGQWQPIEDEVFTIVYGADASVMSEQIQDFATALNTGDSLGRLLGAAVAGDLYADAEDAADANAANKAALQLVVGQLEETAKGVGDAPEARVAKAELLKSMTTVAKALAKLSGIPDSEVPTDFAKLKAFIQSQIDRFLAAGK